MKKIRGFTLLEAVFAIAVTIACVQILFGLVSTLRKINHQKSGVNEITYSYVQVNNFLKESGHVEVSRTGSDPTKVLLKKLSNRKKKNGDPIYDVYAIDVSPNDTLRMRTDEGGHMPLLFKVKRIKCSTTADSFTILVTENDGRQSEMFFKTNLPKEKKELKDDKKESKKS
ncbi:competence type IV pilus minor pilin ComGF [Lactobacillus taiwanensis]|uniref:competence type IV pilus minor pilin ComGF n=1 Tax=Lactobacillus taiwanensis TaxID=508451 RepID=UPI00321F808B